MTRANDRVTLLLSSDHPTLEDHERIFQEPRTPRADVIFSEGPLRAVPCLGCVRSALAGASFGDCHDQGGRTRRCERCANGGTCEVLPDLAVRASLALLSALEAGTALDLVSIRPFVPSSFVSL